MKHILIILALTTTLPFSAQAADLSYSYIEGDYVNFDNDGDGLGLRGSFDFGSSNFYGLASYSNVNYNYVDDGYEDGVYYITAPTPVNVDIDIDSFEIGIGYHHSLNDKADLVAELAYDNLSFDDNGIDGNDTDGFRLSGGFRGALAPKVEGRIMLNYINSSDGDNNDINNLDGDSNGDFSLTIGGQIKFNPTWGLVGEVTFADGGDNGFDGSGSSNTSYLLGLRASF